MTSLLSDEDKCYLILGCFGEFISMIEEDEEEDIDGFFKDLCKMSDDELIDECETSLSPKDFYHLWSNYVPQGYQLEVIQSN